MTHRASYCSARMNHGLRVCCSRTEHSHHRTCPASIHTVHERRRTGGVGVQACPRLPPHGRNLSTRMLPSAVYRIDGLKRRRESKMLGIRGVRRGIIYVTASAMARTYINLTELVSHPAMLPSNEVAPPNINCSNTRCMSAGALAEWACEHMPAAPSSRAKPGHPHAYIY